MRKLIYCASLILIISFSVSAQDSGKPTLTGRLFIDARLSFENSKIISINADDNIESKRKSPFLAGVLSFALPGAGEFYTENYIKSAVFLAVEAVSITIGLKYDKKGDDQTAFFQAYADRHWDVARYAKWTIRHASEINSGVNAADFQVFDQTGKVNWNELNKLESALGSYYSHRLPKYGEQQYFELIGKYPQFNVGWDDFGDENHPFTYGDPLTPNFLYYSVERGKANDFYNIASKAVVIIITNHIISAIDAAWSASSFNKNLKLSAELKRTDIGLATDYYPQLNLQYSF